MEASLNKIIQGLVLVLKKLYPGRRNSVSCDFFMPKTGQLQFSVKAPEFSVSPDWSFDKPGVSFPERNGAIFIEAAPPKGDGKLDWENGKIIFAMGEKDICELLWGMLNNRAPGPIAKLTHSHEDTRATDNKTFSFERMADYQDKPQWKMTLSEMKAGVRRTPVSCFIGGPDYVRFKLMLESALPYVLGFHST